MQADTQFSKSLLDTISLPFAHPADSKDVMTLAEWCNARGYGRTTMTKKLREQVERGVLVETLKHTDRGVAKAWKLKE